MEDLRTNDGRPAEIPATAAQDPHEAAKDWNARQYVPDRVLRWRAYPNPKRDMTLFRVGLALSGFGLLLAVVFGAAYAFVDAESVTLAEYLRANLVAAIAVGVLVVGGCATMVLARAKKRPTA